MSYIVIRNNKSGYVSCVEKKRVKSPDGGSTVRDVGRVCGLGVMSKEDFQNYQTWAHSFKDQELRKMHILASHAAIAVTTRAERESATVKQKKTTVKRVKVEKKEYKSKARHHYPVRQLVGYKGIDKGKPHTRVMMERKRDRAEEEEMRRLKRVQEGTASIEDIEKTPTVEKRIEAPSKFTPEGEAIAIKGKKSIARERVIRKREKKGMI